MLGADRWNLVQCGVRSLTRGGYNALSEAIHVALFDWIVLAPIRPTLGGRPSLPKPHDPGNSDTALDVCRRIEQRSLGPQLRPRVAPAHQGSDGP